MHGWLSVGVTVRYSCFHVVFCVVAPLFSMEQLKGTLESGSTVSSSFALPLNLQMISHCGPLADDASVATVRVRYKGRDQLSSKTVKAVNNDFSMCAGGE